MSVAIKLRKSKKNASRVHWKIGAPADDGGFDEMNLAPRNASETEELEQFAFVSPANPSRDLAAQFAQTRHQESNDTFEDHTSDPRMYFGPTLDEDGYPLHNINII